MIRRVLRGTTAAIIIALALGLAAWMTGRIVTDRWAWSQWLWWIPTPFALAAAVLGVIVLLARAGWLKGSWRAVWVGVVITFIIAIYFSFVEHHLLRGAPRHAEGVLIMHWNWTHAVPHDADRHVDQILAIKPDIGFMTDWGRLTRKASERARLEPEWTVQRVGVFSVMSRWPVTLARTIVANDTTQVALVVIDTTPALGRPLTCLLVDMPSDITIGRMEHMQEVRRMMDEAGLPEIDVAAGDFNTPRGSASLQALLPGVHHAYDDAGHGYAASYFRPLPLYHIDHILLSPNVKATDYRIIDSGFGRHRFQVARIVMTNATSPPAAP